MITTPSQHLFPQENSILNGTHSHLENTRLVVAIGKSTVASEVYVEDVFLYSIRRK